MKQTEVPKDRLYFSADSKTREGLVGLGFLAYDPEFAPDSGIPEGFGMYVAVERDFCGPLMASLIQRGVPVDKIGFVRWRDDEFDAQAVFENLLRPYDYFFGDTSALSGVLDEPDFPTYSSGFPALDPCLKWRLPELVVVAGPYGSGKSLLAQLLGTRFIAVHGSQLDCQALFCSFEDMPGQIRHDVIRHAVAHDIEPAELLSRMHVCIRPASQDRLLSWFIDLVRHHVRKYNVRFVLLDPWNEIDHERDVRAPETEYVRSVMREFRRLVDELQIILMIVTHVPAKNINPDGTFQQFRIAHAFGSVQFANKADRGICVVRSNNFVPRQDRMVIAMDKVKVERLMGRRDVSAMAYDWEAHTLHYDTEASRSLRETWRL